MLNHSIDHSSESHVSRERSERFSLRNGKALAALAANGPSARLRASLLLLLVTIVAATGCASGRLGAPAGEVVRYMARPPVRTVPAPADGSYALFGDPNAPPLFVFDLTAGQPVGFRKGEMGNLYAVAGEQPPFPLNGGERYSWKRQADAGPSSTGSAGGGSAGGGSVQRVDRGAQAQVALDAAERDYAAEQVRLDASRRRLDAARANLKAAGGSEPAGGVE